MRVKGHSKRAGVSEFMGALIMIAITLVAGTAAFGWILSQSGISENAYGNSAANSVNFLHERFTLVSQSFSGLSGVPCPNIPLNGSCRLGSFWLYNTGGVDFTLFTLQLKNLTDTSDNHLVNVVFNSRGFSVFNRAGANITAGCTNGPDVPDGFPGGTNGFIPTTTLSQGSTPSPYHILMPTCPGLGVIYLFDGKTYSVTLTGLYGNVVGQSITPNG